MNHERERTPTGERQKNSPVDCFDFRPKERSDCAITVIVAPQLAEPTQPKRVGFLNDVCLRQMMTAVPNDIRFANDAWLRHILGQTSHHCDQREQHHICEANASYRRRRCIIEDIQGLRLDLLVIM